MEPGQIALDSSMGMIVRQLQTTTDLQVEVLKKIAESQQRVAEILAADGVGQNIDTTA